MLGYIIIKYWKILLRLKDSTNMDRFLISVAKSIPFIFDGNDYDRDAYRGLLSFSGTYGCDVIKIKLNSLDEENVDRIKNRIFDPNHKDPNIVGDSGLYGIPYNGNYEKRKKESFIIADEHSDYIIDNTGSIEFLDEQVKEIATKIKQRDKAR